MYHLLDTIARIKTYSYHLLDTIARIKTYGHQNEKKAGEFKKQLRDCISMLTMNKGKNIVENQWAALASHREINFYLGIKTKQIKTKIINVQWPDV